MPSRIAPVRTAVVPRRESSLDAWHRLHDARMVEPKKVRTAVITPEAKKLSTAVGRGLTPRAAQDMLDELQAFAKTNAFWPELKRMGVTDRQAHAAVNSLKNFELNRRTSVLEINGVVGLKAQVASATKLAAVVNGLVAGKSIDSLVKNLTATEQKVLLQAKRLGPEFVLHSAITMLDTRLEATITDSPADLITFPKETAAALESSIRGRMAWLKMPDSDRGSYVPMAEYGTEFGHLKELAVLDPAKAQLLGKAFVAQLKTLAVGSGTDFAIK